MVLKRLKSFSLNILYQIRSWIKDHKNAIAYPFSPDRSGILFCKKRYSGWQDEENKDAVDSCYKSSLKLHLGSSSYVTGRDGKVTQHMEYLPFGETLTDEHINSKNSPFKYNGKELDEETGNYYYGAR